ncbi:glycosyltransferase family 2 protein [Novipirellula sp. SH528]|uniref:glycosyltransferase family 2 protein n=1 Tax=Novipirellula sp. SH528 TaxID=3454466 RepID=UPI003F9FAE98
MKLPISVLIPTANEEANLEKCLAAISSWAAEIVIVDSQSTDRTLEIAERYGATILQFDYKGGWPKKRNWAIDSHRWNSEWILLLDADEIITPAVAGEIAKQISRPDIDGFWIRYDVVFLGRMLKRGDSSLWKLPLFRVGKGRYELRTESQDESMCDMEVHEHVVVDGTVDRLSTPIRHENMKSLHDYIAKHNNYSTWEVSAWNEGVTGELEPRLFGNQAQRRRWLKRKLLLMPGFSVAVFIYCFIFKLGILDGRAGLIYAQMRMAYYLQINAKIYEHSLKSNLSPTPKVIEYVQR